MVVSAVQTSSEFLFYNQFEVFLSIICAPLAHPSWTPEVRGRQVEKPCSRVHTVLQIAIIVIDHYLKSTIASLIFFFHIFLLYIYIIKKLIPNIKDLIVVTTKREQFSVINWF